MSDKERLFKFLKDLVPDNLECGPIRLTFENDGSATIHIENRKDEGRENTMEQYPGTNFHDLNLDWLLEEMQALREEWEAWRAEHEETEVDEDAPTVTTD